MSGFLPVPCLASWLVDCQVQAVGWVGGLVAGVCEYDWCECKPGRTSNGGGVVGAYVGCSDGPFLPTYCCNYLHLAFCGFWRFGFISPCLYRPALLWRWIRKRGKYQGD